MDLRQHIVIFKDKDIRKIVHNDEWWFVLKDVIETLTGTTNCSDYIKKMKARDPELSKGWEQIVTPLLIDTRGGKQSLSCVNTKGIFRIIQSIPSPKAEAFRNWLAQVGFERIQEIEDLELAFARIRAIYKAKGYSDEWIEKRMQGIAPEKTGANEWDQSDDKERREYCILNAEIAEAAFAKKNGSGQA